MSNLAPDSKNITSGFTRDWPTREEEDQENKERNSQIVKLSDAICGTHKYSSKYFCWYLSIAVVRMWCPSHDGIQHVEGNRHLGHFYLDITGMDWAGKPEL